MTRLALTLRHLAGRLLGALVGDEPPQHTRLDELDLRHRPSARVMRRPEGGERE